MKNKRHCPKSGDDGEDRKRHASQPTHEERIEDVRQILVGERPRARVERHEEPRTGIRQEQKTRDHQPGKLPRPERFQRLVPERTPQPLREEHDEADDRAGDDERMQPQETPLEEGPDAHPLLPAPVVGVRQHVAHQEEEELHAEVAVSADLRHAGRARAVPAVRLGQVKKRHKQSGHATQRVGDDVSPWNLYLHGRHRLRLTYRAVKLTRMFEKRNTQFLPSRHGASPSPENRR